jgi:hypothetical protein
MASPGWALQKAIYEALVANAPLVALLGGPRVYDDVPRGAVCPYVTFGPSVVRDWSTGSEAGTEHLLTLHVWSQENARREAHEIMGALREALHEAALTLTEHRLVSLRHEQSDARREPDGETTLGIVRLRALVEPQP